MNPIQPPNLGSTLRSAVTSTISQAQNNVMRRSTVRTMILYIFVVILVFLALGYVGYALVHYEILPPMSNVGFWNYCITLTLVFLLGLWHASGMRSFMPWTQPDRYLQGTLMTLLMGIIGALCLFILSFAPSLFRVVEAQEEFRTNIRPLVSAVLLFPLPYFLDWAYEAYDVIPPKIYKLWQYNPMRQMPQLLEYEYKQTTIIIFMLDIRYGERNSYDLRSKIPNRMMIGDGFQFSIDEHNTNEPGREIDFRDLQGGYYRWYFYVKRGWWRADLFIDSDKTCPENYLRDGVRILAKRLPPPNRRR